MNKKQEELYDDVMLEDNEIPLNDKAQITFTKRLQKSIGWITLEQQKFSMVDKNNKTWVGAPYKEKEVWDVNVGDSAGFECDTQIDAWLLSYLVQVNERLKRIENKLNENSKTVKTNHIVHWLDFERMKEEGVARYICNQSVYPTPNKSTLNISEVTCINCLRKPSKK